MRRRLADGARGKRSRGSGGPVLLVASAAVVAIGTVAIGTAGTAIAAPAAVSQPPLSAALAGRLSPSATRHVLVFMKDQPAVAAPGSAAAKTRASAIAASQSQVLGELAQVRATHVIAYHLVNALAATVSAGEAARLAANPAVRRVIPDSQIQGPAEPARPGGPARPAAGQSVRPLRGACLPRGKAQLEPEALALTGTQSASRRARTARSLGFTGAGVTVAWMAEGIDINNVNFIRPGGKSVFTGYRDFSGDGTRAPTDGAESFLDANAIAGQGRHTYNIQHFSAQSPKAPCNIRIEGVAPGVKLIGLKVYGTHDVGTTSGFIAAIQYAVDHRVNVLSQSFGNDGLPDITTLDALDQADNAAVRAGVTVVVSTGDSGPFNMIATPATDPGVLSVGASTDFRFYAMTNYAEADQFARTGWLNDNISPLSSSGFDAAGRTLDMVAPGDLSFASCSTDTKIYAGCTNFLGHASGIEESGGTSQSAPLTAGAAALVIQAYRKSHHGRSPAPALVKQILLSTATDLRAPASEQGAGLLNSYKAVQVAESVHTSAGSPRATGSTLLASASQLNATGPAGAPESWKVTVTNTGSAAQTVRLSGRSFGPAQVAGTGSVTLSNAHSRHFTDYTGARSNYGELHFEVGKGQNRLSAEIGYPGDPARGLDARARLILIDPRGRFAAHSLPQGIGNFGNVDVVNPAPGRWTAIIFCRQAGNAGGTAGRILFQASTQRFTSFGSVSPAALRLKARASGVFSFAAATPAQPGDAYGSVVLNSGHGATSIPVTLRSLVDAAGGQAFSGTVTGGNGRDTGAAGNGQVQYYEFTVPSGQPDVSAEVALANDPANVVDSYLVNPDGQLMGYGSNYLATAFDNTTGQFTYAPKLQTNVFAASAVPGRWTLVIVFNNPVAGNELSDHYTGSISLTAGASAAAAPPSPPLPDSTATTLPQGVSSQFSIAVTNNGAAPEDFFADPRLSALARISLPLLNSSSTFPLPLTGADFPAEWVVPTQTTQVSVTATGSRPVTFSYGPFLGDPLTYVSSRPASKVQLSSFRANLTGTDPVAPGGWYAVPNETEADGYTTKPAPKGSVRVTVSAVTQEFDPAVSSSTGDFWQGAVNPFASFSIFPIGPGQTGTITVTITPTGKPGTVVSGTLYIDDFVPATQDSGSELLAIPYAYTIGS